MEKVMLNNGVTMPVLGFGVFQIPDAKECERCVLDAIEVGYRSIDTAQIYGNEEAVGRAAEKSGVPREELFLTTKVWISNGGYEKAKASIDEFYPDRFVDLAEFCEIRPAVNQVETHVFHQQEKVREVMEKYGTRMESWGPFAEGRNGFFSNPVLKGIGEKYGKTPAQTALRFLIQRGIIAIPKTTHRERMEENFNVFDFALSLEDMGAIARLDRGESLFLCHRDPESILYLINYGKQ